VRVGREEAVDIFRKWFSERSLLRCDMAFSRLAATFRVRVAFVSRDEVKFISDDTTSEMALLLEDDLVFGYGEPRGFPEEAGVFDCALVLFFSGTDNRISFTQIIEHP
jgi:hypothetical protein